MRVVPNRSIIRFLALASMLAACGSPATDLPPQSPTLALTVGVPTASLQQAGTATIPVTITRGGGFTGAVTVSVTGLPAGVTAPSVTIAEGATTGTITLTGAADATPGTATLTVHATGAGVTEQTSTVALSTAVRGTYTLVAAPAALTVVQGAVGHSDITVTRAGNFGGTVALVATPSTGLTAVLATPSVVATATGSGLDITVPAGTAVGTYNVSVTGTTAGLANQTTSVAVTVTPSGAFTIAAPSTLTVAQGSSANGIVNVTRTGTFTGAVALTATAPAGLTVTFNPPSATGVTAGVTVAAASTVTAGTYNVVVQGNATGFAQQTSTIVVTVGVPVPAITMVVSPSPIAVNQGAAAGAGLTIARLGGFTGAVTLTTDAAPAGITVSLNPTSIGSASTTSAILIAASPTAAVGTFNITIRGNGPGITESVVTVPVVVSVAPPSIFLAALPAALTVGAGASATTTVSIARNGGFAGAVTLTADTPPTGITVAFNPASLTGTTLNSTMTVTAASTVAGGTYNVTVRANGTGVTEKVITVPVTVTPQGFTLSAAPPALTIQAGSSGTTTIAVNRLNGFTGQVNVTAFPFAAIGVSFTNSTANSIVATLNVASTQSAGTFNVVFTGTSAGSADATVTVPVTITAAPIVTSGSVSYYFCDASGIPLWVAAQGTTNGAWQQITSANNIYTFNVSGTGGIAYVVPRSGGGFETRVTYGTLVELQERGNQGCDGIAGADKTVSVNATGLLSSDFAAINLGTSNSPSSTSPFTLPNVIPGPRDLIAGQIHVNSDATTGMTTLTPGKFILQRDLDIPNGGSAGTIDFANGITPVSATITLNNLLGHQAGITSVLVTPTSGGFYNTELATTSTTHTWYGYPAASLRAGDLYELIITTGVPGDNSVHRGVIVGLNSVRNATFTLGAVLNFPTMTVTSRSPYLRMKQDYVIQPDYNQYYDGSFGQGNGTTTRRWSIHTSTGVTGTTVASLEIPDLSGVTGWQNTWGLQAGQSTDFGFTATAATGTPPSTGTTQGVFDGVIYLSATKNLLTTVVN